MTKNRYCEVGLSTPLLRQAFAAMNNSHDSKTHEQAQAHLTAEADLDLPQNQDWKSREEEVGDDRDECFVSWI